MPDTSLEGSSGSEHVSKFLERYPEIRYVRLHWVDYSGVLHTRFVTTAHFRDSIITDSSRYTVVYSCMITPISTAPGCFPTGPERWELLPDHQTLRVCGFRKHHASVMCSVSHTDLGGDLLPLLSKCPRSAAERVVRRLEESYGITMQLGFELEFVLLDACLEPVKPIDHIAGASLTAGLRGATLDAVEEVIESLESSGITIHHFHTEVADQLEIALIPKPPIQAIDELILAQETTRTVFARRGMKATLAPKPLVGVPGPQNGCHLHLSLNDASPAQSSSFIAGILDRMKAICAFGMANYDSYARVVPDGAGMWIGWGTENRQLPIRKVGDDHWEFRFPDATANIYLVLTAILGAGLDGIESGAELRFKDCQVFPQKCTYEQLQQYGITERMATSLQEALKAAGKDEVIQNYMGKELLARYIDVKEKEIDRFSGMSEKVRREKFLTFF